MKEPVAIIVPAEAVAPHFVVRKLISHSAILQFFGQNQLLINIPRYAAAELNRVFFCNFQLILVFLSSQLDFKNDSNFYRNRSSTLDDDQYPSYAIYYCRIAEIGCREI